MIFEGYLRQLIVCLGLPNIFDQILNGSIVSLMLRIIEHSSLYERIIKEISSDEYIEYMQAIFEKYEMEE
jgi:hypothetical protein